MSSRLQLLMLCINYIYGFCFFYIILINYNFIKNEVLLLRIIITVLCIMDITILYLIIVYKFTYGVFHIYYLITFILGYMNAISVKKHVKLTINVQKLIDTIKRR